MNLLVDTSVWSLAMRRDAATGPHVEFLGGALDQGEGIFTTGLILQELLQGFIGPRNKETILESFAALPMIVPQRDDYVAAAALRNQCRQNGVQVSTIDALIALLSIDRDLTLLTADADFEHIAKHQPLKLWRP